MAVEFVNPYNFIPLMHRRAQAESTRGSLSGVIEYTVLTKTPVIIPNSSSDKAFWKEGDECGGDGTKDYHKSYDFFSYNDLKGEKGRNGNYSSPVIPGSEMRGVLRSNFEILSNSCMSSLDTDTPLSKRPNYPYQPGLLYLAENKTFELIKARDLIARTMGANSLKDNLRPFKSGDENRASYIQKSLREGQRVSFAIQGRDRGKAFARNIRNYDGKGFWGCVIKGVEGAVSSGKNKKHLLHVFIPEDSHNNKVSAVSSEILATMTNVLKEYKKNEVSDYREYEREFNNFVSGNGANYFPVYYSLVKDSENKGNKRIYLSPACNTRDMYYNKLKNIAGKYAPCESRNDICPACSLFGMVGDAGESLASRVRVTDLTCSNDNLEDCYYADNITLPELSSPKLNNMEFYLKQPENAWFWTYDYYIDNSGKTHLYTPELNGRKFYWHSSLTKNTDAKRTKRNVTVRPVREGLEFKGKLYFDQVTESELKQLIWLLNCGDNGELSEHEHGYKIGMAKPLGFGSIAIKTNSVCLKTVCVDSENHTIKEDECAYSVDPSDLIFGTSLDHDANMKNFRKMTAFNTVTNENVSYPKLTNDPAEEGFNWFVNNHKDKNGYGMSRSLNDVIFMKHLRAMNPKVEFTGAQIQKRSSGGKGKGKRN